MISPIIFFYYFRLLDISIPDIPLYNQRRNTTNMKMISNTTSGCSLASSIIRRNKAGIGRQDRNAIQMLEDGQLATIQPLALISRPG